MVWGVWRKVGDRFEFDKAFNSFDVAVDYAKRLGEQPFYIEQVPVYGEEILRG